MNYDKRDIPLVVLEVLERYSEKVSTLFQISDSSDALLKFEDNHPYPKFYFEFKSFDAKNNKQYLILNFKPRSKNDPTGYKVTTEVTQVEGFFKNWTSYLEGYNEIKIFDDPILKQYEDEIYSEFEVIDEDADDVSYDLKTQLWIDQYLDGVLLKLESYKKDEPIVEQLKEEVHQLKSNQTKLTKKKIAQSLARIYAKARKIGIPLLKEIYVEAKKELIKQLISGKIEIM